MKLMHRWSFEKDKVKSILSYRRRGKDISSSSSFINKISKQRTLAMSCLCALKFHHF